MFHLFQRSGFVWGVGKARGETRSCSICAQLQGAFRGSAYITVLPKYHNRIEECHNPIIRSQAEEETETEQVNEMSRTMSFCPLGLRQASEETSMSLLLKVLVWCWSPCVGRGGWKGQIEEDYGEDMKVAGVREKDELQHTSILFSTAKSEVKHFLVQLQLISDTVTWPKPSPLTGVCIHNHDTAFIVSETLRFRCLSFLSSSTFLVKCTICFIFFQNFAGWMFSGPTQSDFLTLRCHQGCYELG